MMGQRVFQEVDFDHPSKMFVFEDKLKRILGGPLFYRPYIRTFGLKGGERVLDFGCGGGMGSLTLLRFLNGNGHLTCVDISKYWMSKAKQRLKGYSNVELIQGDIRELDIPDSLFDVIFTIHVIHDIRPELRPGIANALARKLKRGGTLFIREPTGESHGMSIEEIRELLQSVGLKEVGHRSIGKDYAGRFSKLQR